MLKIIIFIAIYVTVSHGDSIVPSSPPVYCGETPSNILTCLKSPHILPADVLSKCSRSDQCESLTCAFKEANLMKHHSVDKAKVKDHFNQLAKDKPDWKTVIDQIVPNCVDRQLSPQGVFLNCPAYDIMHCALIHFVQKTPDSRWDQAASCVYPRQFAASCAVCPSDCYSPQIPIGSCNACYAVPTRT